MREQNHGVESPQIGRWYCCNKDRLFEVVAVDEFAGTIELQFFDGTVDEADPERWLSMRPQYAEPPEDWSGSVDVNDEDLPDTNQHIFLDWKSELEHLDGPEPTEEID